MGIWEALECNVQCCSCTSSREGGGGEGACAEVLSSLIRFQLLGRTAHLVSLTHASASLSITCIIIIFLPELNKEIIYNSYSISTTYWLPEIQPDCVQNGHNEGNDDDNAIQGEEHQLGEPLGNAKADERWHNEKDANKSKDLPELWHDGRLGAASLVHQLDRRVLVGERETALHLGFWSYSILKRPGWAKNSNYDLCKLTFIPNVPSGWEMCALQRECLATWLGVILIRLSLTSL